MSTPQTAINLYSVRDLGEPLAHVLDRVAEAGYDGVQFAGPYTPIAAESDPETIADGLDARGLGVTRPHVGVDTLRDDREAVRTAYDPFDVDGVVVPWFDPSRFDSPAAVDETAAELNALADDLAADGWDLHYHNHAHEYTAIDGAVAFDRFLDRTRVGIELDVGWAHVGGDSPADRLRELGDRVSQVHLKDMRAGTEPGFADIGTGGVNIAGCLEAGRAIDVEWLIYEHDDPADPAVTIEEGAAFLHG